MVMSKIIIARNILHFSQMLTTLKPASVAQSDARLTGDQEDAGLIPSGTGTILSWRLIMKSFLPSFSLFR